MVPGGCRWFCHATQVAWSGARGSYHSVVCCQPCTGCHTAPATSGMQQVLCCCACSSDSVVWCQAVTTSAAVAAVLQLMKELSGHQTRGCCCRLWCRLGLGAKYLSHKVRSNNIMSCLLSRRGRGVAAAGTCVDVSVCMGAVCVCMCVCWDRGQCMSVSQLAAVVGRLCRSALLAGCCCLPTYCCCCAPCSTTSTPPPHTHTPKHTHRAWRHLAWSSS